MSEMQSSFEAIYASDAWTHGSGPGSLLAQNRDYIAFLEGFLRRHGIRSVVDMGCGDWQFSRHVDWGGADYQGYDVVASVVAANQASFARAGVRFHHYAGDPAELPAADLLIAKDVLQHWSERSIRAFLPQLSRFRHALLTNCVMPEGETPHRDIEDGGFRQLDLRQAPFHLPAREVFQYSKQRSLLQRLLRRPSWRKLVLHLGPGDAGV